MENWHNLRTPLSDKVFGNLPCHPVGYFHKDKERFCASVLEQDMSGGKVEACLCIWVDRDSFMPGMRKAYFALKDGRYLGDAFL